VAIKSYVIVWVCYETLQQTVFKINIQASEGIGYQSLTKEEELSKEEEEEEEIPRASVSPPIVVCRLTPASAVGKVADSLLQCRSVVSCRAARPTVHAGSPLKEA